MITHINILSSILHVLIKLIFNNLRWYSPEAYLLFVPELERKKAASQSTRNDILHDQETIIKDQLNSQLSLFRRAWLTENGWRNMIHDKDINNHYNNVAIFDIRNKAKYLAKAIEIAIVSYDDIGWTACCDEAIKSVNKFECVNDLEVKETDIYNSRWCIKWSSTLMKWYREFNHHNNQHFINPYTAGAKKTLPTFIENNRDIKEAIIAYCNSNLLELTVASLQEFIITKCFPTLLETRKKELNNPHLTINFILHKNNIKNLCRQTVATWMNLLGFRYCERKKSYYCDSHEKPENVKYRYKYIDRYLEREFRCFRWIQISESEYLKMIEDGHVFCGDPYEFLDNDGNKKFEFHVDDCEEFSQWTSWPDDQSRQFGGCLSVRMPKDVKPIIVFGQDECIFKQYIFTKKSWMGPEGQTAMVPKEEGHGLMMSSFVSRDYGFNMQLTPEKLKLVNTTRKGEQYKDVEAATLKRGNSSKKDLEVSPFSRKLEYGNSKDGYWSYEDMVLQLEDCVDVLKAINGDKYDYCFLFDHSNGHDRLRPDGLNINKISKYYGGKQASMRDTTILDDNYLGPFNHDKKLKIGYVQKMSWEGEDCDGPYYMSNSMRLTKEFDKSHGITKEVDLNKNEMTQNLKNIGVNVKGKRDDLVKLCRNNNLPLKKSQLIVDEGWLNKPKGALQVLWERDWIDPKKSHTYYTKNGHTDLYGILDETSSIKCLMAKQPDFLEQETLLQYYAKKLGVESDRSPVCHPEIAGEGIEFDWGCSKVYYRSQPLCRKRSKENFITLVNESLGMEILSIKQSRSNARRARMYMLAYKALEDSYYEKENTTEIDVKVDTTRYNHTLIEKCVNLFKRRRVHRNVVDFDKKYLENERMKHIMLKMHKPEIKKEEKTV